MATATSTSGQVGATIQAFAGTQKAASSQVLDAAADFLRSEGIPVYECNFASKLNGHKFSSARAGGAWKSRVARDYDAGTVPDSEAGASVVDSRSAQKHSQAFTSSPQGRGMKLRRGTNKFNAKAMVIDGHRFASIAESKRYGELRLLEKAGEISELELQPEFPLKVQLTTGTVMGAAKALTGQHPVIGTYVADFAYRDKFDDRIVEDVKSPPTRTALYRWKKKHVEAQYGVRIVEIGA